MYIYICIFILSCYPFFRHVLIFFDLQGSMLNGQNSFDGSMTGGCQRCAKASWNLNEFSRWRKASRLAQLSMLTRQALGHGMKQFENRKLRKWMEMNEHGMEYMSLCFYDSPVLWLLRRRASNINPQTEDGVLARSNAKQKEE